MLNNFFRKHANNNSVRDHLGGFQDSFTERQKKSIMNSLLLIAYADREFDGREIKYFEETSTILGYKLHYSLEDTIDEFTRMSREEVLSSLNGLDESQKDWYIVTVFGMINADGKVFEEEFLAADTFFNNMGISLDRCERVLKKAQLFSEMFN